MSVKYMVVTSSLKNKFSEIVFQSFYRNYASLFLLIQAVIIII